MKNFIIYSIVTLLYSYCLYSQEFKEFRRINIDLEKPNKEFFSTIRKVEIVRLEETSNSLLANAEYYFKTDSGIAIVNKDIKPYSIVLFDQNGDFKNLIQKFGPGPEEYLNISDAWFHNSKIELFSGYSRAIHRFNQVGEYVETLKGNYDKGILGGNATPYQGGYIIQQVNPSGPLTSFPYYALIYTDGKLNFMRNDVLVSEPNPIPASRGRNFSYVNGSLVYKKALSDSIFEIKDGKNHPLFKLDFGEMWAWGDTKNLESLKNATKVFLGDTKVVKVIPCISSNYMMLTFYIGIENEQKGVINLNTGEYFTFDMEQQNGKKAKIDFLKWEDDILVCSINSTDLKSFLGNLKSDQYLIKGKHKLEDVIDTENPFLIRISFNENLAQ